MQRQQTKLRSDSKRLFDMTTQIALGSAKTRFSNSAFVDYEIDGNSYREAAQANSWMDTTWTLNALKAGIFIPKGGDVKSILASSF